MLCPPVAPGSRKHTTRSDEVQPGYPARSSSRLNSSRNKPCLNRHPIGAIKVIPTGGMGGRTADLLAVMGALMPFMGFCDLLFCAKHR